MLFRKYSDLRPSLGNALISSADSRSGRVETSMTIGPLTEATVTLNSCIEQRTLNDGCNQVSITRCLQSTPQLVQILAPATSTVFYNFHQPACIST
jgi:hypothetical protein